jgi:hypothetical protein
MEGSATWLELVSPKVIKGVSDPLVASTKANSLRGLKELWGDKRSNAQAS